MDIRGYNFFIFLFPTCLVGVGFGITDLDSLGFRFRSVDQHDDFKYLPRD
jgi:hypothetical protein